MHWEAVIFDGSALIAGLFLLKYGANSFIENSALILEEIGISPTLSHLVTAGAEWEEVCLLQSTLAPFSFKPLIICPALNCHCINFSGTYFSWPWKHHRILDFQHLGGTGSRHANAIRANML
jgi:hypothetical protein